MENKCKNCGSKSKNSKCPHSINYEHDFDNINIQEETEILKMSDNNLVEKFEEECIHQWSSGDKLIIREELLKRLSKNRVDKKEFEENDVLLAQYFGKNIEYKEKVIGEFKKKLIEEIKKSYFIPSNKEDQNIIKKLNPLFETYKNNIIDLINN